MGAASIESLCEFETLTVRMENALSVLELFEDAISDEINAGNDADILSGFVLANIRRKMLPALALARQELAAVSADLTGKICEMARMCQN